MKRIISYLKNTPIIHLFKFSINVLSSKLVQIIAEFLFTLWISIEVNGYSNGTTKSITLVFIAVLNIFFLILIQCVNKYNEKEKSIKLEEDIKKQNQMNNAILSDCRKLIISRSDVLQNQGKSDIIEVIADTMVQNSLKEISKKIFKFIAKNYRCENLEVVMFQQFISDDDKSFIAPVAFGNKEDVVPNCFGTKYWLESESLYLITQIFMSGKSDSVAFLTQREIKKNFTYKDKASKDSEKIKQYIAIPARTIQGITTIVLQICFYQDRIIHKNGLSKFINEHIRPYLQIAELFIDEQIIIDDIVIRR